MAKQKATDEQIIQAYHDHGSQRLAAEALGMSSRNFERRLAKMRQSEARIQPIVPDGQVLRGVSTLVDVVDPLSGEVRQQWIKTKCAPKTEQEAEAIQAEVLSGFNDKIVRATPVKRKTKKVIADMANLHVVTDYHLGMLAWDKEAGEDWDLDIAEQLLIDTMTYAVKRAPAAEQGILCQLGDFLHYDSFESVTPRSKHVLDSDSRPQKMIGVAIRVLKQTVEIMLQKYETVHVLMAEGNHDIIGSAWLRESFDVLYENEPRVTVETRPDPYYCFVWGDVALFFHHGHLKPPATVDVVFARKFREEYGAAKFAHAHLGHLHHEKKLETTLMKVEQHPTMAAADAHASRGGWMSDREMKVLTYHKKYGPYGWFTITPQMVKDNA